MRQVSTERVRARGPTTTGARATAEGGSRATQPTLDVVVGGASVAPIAEAVHEAAITPTSEPASEPTDETARAATVESVLINRELSWLDFNARVLA